jgi:hypothetical protein
MPCSSQPPKNGEMSPQPTIIPRLPDEPAANLTDYVVVHRAMTVDVGRLAEVAAGFALQRERPVPARALGLRDDLAGVSAEIHCHHQVEDDAVGPVLLAAAEADPRLATLAALAALTDDHHRLGPLLDAGAELAEAFAGHPDNVAVAADLAATLPWVVRHATPQELPALVAEAGWQPRVLLRIFQGRFVAREQLVLGAASAAGAADQRPQ